MLKNKKKKKGFTLIELIIVIAIIAVLAAIALPKFGDVRRKANISADIANAKQIQSAVALVIAEDKTSTDTETFVWGADGAANSIKSEAYAQLQSANIKSKVDSTKSFVVKVVAGDIKVYVNANATDGQLTVNNQIYPEPQTTTNNIWYGGTAPTKNQ